MAITMSTALRNAAADAMTTLVDAGTEGFLKIYADDDTLLATLTLSATSFGAAVNGVATANAITDDASADDTGTASYFTVTNSTPTEIFRGTVGVGSGDLQLNTVAIVSGVPVSVSSLTYTQPAS